MRTFETVDQADDYLNDLAKSKNIQNYNVWEGERLGKNVMILTEEDFENTPIRDIEIVTFKSY